MLETKATIQTCRRQRFEKATIRKATNQTRANLDTIKG
jgi:hypothetical protein